MMVEYMRKRKLFLISRKHCRPPAHRAIIRSQNVYCTSDKSISLQIIQLSPSTISMRIKCSFRMCRNVFLTKIKRSNKSSRHLNLLNRQEKKKMFFNRLIITSQHKTQNITNISWLSRLFFSFLTLSSNFHRFQLWRGEVAEIIGAGLINGRGTIESRSKHSERQLR